MTTLGDRVTGVALSKIGDKGIFTRELEDGLRTGAIDLAVHSLKDLPTELPGDLEIGAVLERDDPRDVLVGAPGVTIALLPAGARVGTSSLRRRAQVAAIRSDLRIVDIRGNVPTRLESPAGRGGRRPPRIRRLEASGPRIGDQRGARSRGRRAGSRSGRAGGADSARRRSAGAAADGTRSRANAACDDHRNARSWDISKAAVRCRLAHWDNSTARR